jgi:hypothetical protein
MECFNQLSYTGTSGIPPYVTMPSSPSLKSVSAPVQTVLTSVSRAVRCARSLGDTLRSTCTRDYIPSSGDHGEPLV